jgi:AcrR family transcriptional regulator
LSFLQEQNLAEDHRVRVAREKRSRMRAHLLQAVMKVYSRVGFDGSAVIEDVVKEADVARGTFYKYFESLEQAVAELGLELALEMTEGILSVYDVLDDPALRTATGFQMFLLRAKLDPEWGAFIAHIGLLSGDNLFANKIQDDLRLGVETGDYVVDSIEIATDLLMGAKIEAILRIIAGGRDTDYIRSMASMVLRSFGVSPTKADKTVLKAFDRLAIEAPGKIAWWRPVD